MRLAGLAAAAAAALALSAPAAAQDVAIALQPGEVLLKVEAKGQVPVRPDMVTFTAGVVTTGDSAARALAENSAVADRMIEAVRRSGVEPRDVRTTRLSVRPQMEELSDEADEAGRPPRIVGYVATNQLQLRVRHLDRVPQLIDALFTSGANEVDGPNFSTSDETSTLRRARQAAVAAAREEAETYAEALGMRVGRVLRVSERDDLDTSQGYITVTGSRIRRGNLEAGEIDAELTVWVDYALVPR